MFVGIIFFTKLAFFGQLLVGGGLGIQKTEVDTENDARLWSFEIVGSLGVDFFVNETWGLEMLYGRLGFTQINHNYRDSGNRYFGTDSSRSFGLNFDKTSVRLGINFMY
ncbi:MAG: hypothetical protein RIG62_22630 [Cyclobacteriaceae bacterium]